VSDHIQYEAPRPAPGQLTVTIPLSYFNMLVESYYTGRREPQQVVQQPLERPQTDEQFINSNFNGIDLMEDMPPGWARVKKKADTNGK
jgi:hypothetical protein